MTKIVKVIYENGVFKPLEKMDLPEKTKLIIKIEAIESDSILNIAKNFRKKINLNEIKEDPLQVLLEMRER